MKFDSRLTFEDHVHGIVSRVSTKWNFKVGERAILDTSVLHRCYPACVLLILEYCSPVWGSAAECLQLLECPVYSVGLDQTCRCVVNVMLLHCVFVQS